MQCDTAWPDPLIARSPCLVKTGSDSLLEKHLDGQQWLQTILALRIFWKKGKVSAIFGPVLKELHFLDCSFGSQVSN